MAPRSSWVSTSRAVVRETLVHREASRGRLSASWATSWSVRTGVVLGCGASTRIGFWSWYTVPLAALLLGSTATGAVVYGTYGFIRGLGAGFFIVATWVGRARMGLNADSVAVWALGRRPAAQKLAGAHLVAFGLAIVAVLGM